MATRMHVNRLNLPNMVDQQLRSTPMKTYFNPVIVREDLEAKKSGRNIISSSLNSLMATVHRKLRTRKYRALQKRQIDRTEAENALKTATNEQNSTTKNPTQNKSKTDQKTKGKHDAAKSKPKIEQTKPTHPKKQLTSKSKPAAFGSATPRSVTQVNNQTIPQIKAMRTMRARVRPMRITATPQTQRNVKILGNQRRIEEMRRQKRILEDMLDEHEKLRRDRHTIAVEIQSMRERLTDIRRKLDLSLRKLQTTPVSNLSLKSRMPSDINRLTVVRSRQH